jgi:hypothetical protein
MSDDHDHEHDEIGRLIAEDPNANLVQSEGTTIWLATGDQVKLARDLVAKKQKQPQ